MLVPFANKNLTCCSSQDDDRKIEIEKKSNEVYIVKVMEKKQDKSGQKDFKEVEKFALALASI